MDKQTDTFTIEVPAAELGGQTFEQQRSEIYALKGDEVDRSLMLTYLTESLSSGNTSVYSRILEQALSGGDKLVSSKSDRYRVVLSQGLITDIQHILPIAEDRRATARAKAMEAHVPWGHKKNNSSFRTRNLAEARPRMH